VLASFAWTWLIAGTLANAPKLTSTAAAAWLLLRATTHGHPAMTVIRTRLHVATTERPFARASRTISRPVPPVAPKNKNLHVRSRSSLV